MFKHKEVKIPLFIIALIFSVLFIHSRYSKINNPTINVKYIDSSSFNSIIIKDSKDNLAGGSGAPITFTVQEKNNSWYIIECSQPVWLFNINKKEPLKTAL